MMTRRRKRQVRLFRCHPEKDRNFDCLIRIECIGEEDCEPNYDPKYLGVVQISYGGEGDEFRTGVSLHVQEQGSSSVFYLNLGETPNE